MRRNPIIVAGRVLANGVSVSGSGFTVVKESTGIYFVTITEPGFKLVAVTVSRSDGNGIMSTSAPTARTFRVHGMTNGGAVADYDFGFTAVGG
jgi:hypothetical protein